MGTPIYTVAKFLEAIRGKGQKDDPDYLPACGGIVTTVAKRAGCDWHTAKKWIDEHETLRLAFQDERERVLDLCETRLIDSINQGDIDSAKWMLSRLGRNRGYVERTQTELTGAGGGPVEHEVTIKDDAIIRKLLPELASTGTADATSPAE